MDVETGLDAYLMKEIFNLSTRGYFRARDVVDCRRFVQNWQSRVGHCHDFVPCSRSLDFQVATATDRDVSSPFPEISGSLGAGVHQFWRWKSQVSAANTGSEYLCNDYYQRRGVHRIRTHPDANVGLNVHLGSRFSS